jgi:thiol-disulfide isomerase/thioredoxin
MNFPRRRIARAIDLLAVLVVVYAVAQFVVVPRLAPAKPAAAPPVRLTQLGGGRFALDAHHGEVVFLDFWASWCEPCQLSLPLVEHYAHIHPGAQVIAVNVGEPESAARGYARSHGLGRVALDPDSVAASAFGVTAFPTMVVIDADGRVRAKWVGYNPAIEAFMTDASTRYGHAATTSSLPPSRVATR